MKTSTTKPPVIEVPNPGKPSRCTFKFESKAADSPHTQILPALKPKIFPNVLTNIGNTPLIRLNRIGKDDGIKCEILAKCEYFNAGGSVKDRIALRMVEDAEKKGDIKPGDTLIEPTSGNTGIGLALAAAVKGYKCVIVMPEKMSLEKVDVLRALGTEIVRTPTTAAFDSPESNISVAHRLLQELPNAHILNQYTNPSNPLAHYDGTAEEILLSCDGVVDMVVMGAGTGGTVTGVARKIKQKCPKCIVVAVDPFGSILAQPDSLNKSDNGFYEIEGIGYDFVPTVLDRSHVDHWVKVNDKDSFSMSRRLIREEGLLCGGSSGSAVAGALKAIKHFNLGDKKSVRVVTILPDSVRNYMSKFLSDDWMYDRGFIDRPNINQSNIKLLSQKVSSLELDAPMTVQPDLSVGKTLQLLNKEGFDQVPVVESNGVVMGMATVGLIMSMLMKKTITSADAVSKAIYKNFKKVSINATLSQLSRLLDIDHFVLVVHQQRQVLPTGDEVLKEMIYGIVTRIDLVNFMVQCNQVNCADEDNHEA